MVYGVLHPNKHPNKDNGNPNLIKEITPNEAFPILFFNQFRPLYHRFSRILRSRSGSLRRGNRRLHSYLLDRFFYDLLGLWCYNLLRLCRRCLLLFGRWCLSHLWRWCFFYRWGYLFICYRLKYLFRFGYVSLSWGSCRKLLQLALH